MFYNAPMHSDLNPAAIARHCRSAGSAAIVIEVVRETGSTNADLLARIGATGSAVDGGAPDVEPGPMLLVAHRQTAGRGRAGRQWLSDAGSLTFSVAWRFTRPLSGLVGLPLVVGVALAEVLRRRGADVGLKWPNDVLLDGQKLAGVLIETTAVTGRAGKAGVVGGGGDGTWAVIGIGLNLVASADIEQQASGLARALPIARLPATDRNQLLAEVLDALADCLPRFDVTGFAPWARRWNALHAFAGREVWILDGTRELHAGRASGVDDSGRLLLETSAGTVAVMAGDVSLRPVTEAH